MRDAFRIHLTLFSPLRAKELQVLFQGNNHKFFAMLMSSNNRFPLFLTDTKRRKRLTCTQLRSHYCCQLQGGDLIMSRIHQGMALAFYSLFLLPFGVPGPTSSLNCVDSIGSTYILLYSCNVSLGHLILS
jgi:hypothetical protein